MKTLFQRLTAGLGFIMLLGTAAIGAYPVAALSWLIVSVSLLFAGRAFTFQQK